MTAVTFSPRPISVSDAALARFMNYAYDCGVSPDEMLASFIESFDSPSGDVELDDEGYPVLAFDESRMNVMEPKVDAATGGRMP
ncbi:hypothetical protein H7U32_04725 [Bifidobacterium pullorum subsp. saeculare]|uniref:Uncharacterized protein n=1 Tax=Bifidobacterium pullorum subsp. saeculare TaxID=78257 RepID=A0A938WXW1_9BIFI|nr:hypothetical protein [Bifidobacterium pullorum]MBM6699628.1 hypothetical protein [Bifidobacterium pullorum subsp. saeculare]